MGLGGNMKLTKILIKHFDDFYFPSQPHASEPRLVHLEWGEGIGALMTKVLCQEVVPQCCAKLVCFSI